MSFVLFAQMSERIAQALQCYSLKIKNLWWQVSNPLDVFYPAASPRHIVALQDFDPKDLCVYIAVVICLANKIVI